jgi:DNA-binding MarR family transcriptional regulator
MAVNFLVELFKQTNGDTEATSSMYDIGEALSLDKPTASKVAEDLIGMQLIEIRTLSGGVGITEAGVEKAVQHGAEPASPGGGKIVLGDGPVISDAEREAVEQATAEIKVAAGGFNLDFNALNELMADVKTIDVQMMSPRPKTAVIRECCRSLKHVIQNTEAREILDRLRALLGET